MLAIAVSATYCIIFLILQLKVRTSGSDFQSDGEIMAENLILSLVGILVMGGVVGLIAIMVNFSGLLAVGVMIGATMIGATVILTKKFQEEDY